MSRFYHLDDDDAPLTESVVISRIESALDHVLEDLGFDKDQSSVKPEKYIFLTVKNFSDSDEPITYSWFKWGASALAGPGGERTNKTLETDAPSAEKILQTELSEIEDFIKTGDHRLPIETWWNKRRLDFLERFYEEYAPPEYRDLYMANIALERDIEFVESVVQREVDLIGEDTYQNVGNHTWRLEQAVRRINGVSDDYHVVRYFTELFRDTVLALIELSGEEIETGQQTAVSELATLYQELVWPLIAHRLSLQSARGPNIDAIHSWSLRNHDQLLDDFQQTEVREICEAVGLLREFKSYPEANDQSDYNSLYDKPVVEQVLDSQEDIPIIKEFLSEHGIRTLADLVDLTFKHADGEITYRSVAKTIGISSNTAFEMLKVLTPFVAEAPEAQTLRLSDIDVETRNRLLPNDTE